MYKKLFVFLETQADDYQICNDALSELSFRMMESGYDAPYRLDVIKA